VTVAAVIMVAMKTSLTDLNSIGITTLVKELQGRLCKLPGLQISITLMLSLLSFIANKYLNHTNAAIATAYTFIKQAALCFA